MEKRSLYSTPIDLNLPPRRAQAPPNPLIAEYGVQGLDEEHEAEKKRGKKTKKNSVNSNPPAVDSDANKEVLQPSEDHGVVNATGNKRGNEVFAVAPAGSDDSSGDAPAVVPKKPKGREKHWVEYFLQKVPFKSSKLSGRAKQVVEKMTEYPEQMYQCLVAEHYDGTGQHHEFLLIPPKRDMHQNIVTHFDGHSRIKSYMEEALGNGEILERAAAACFQMLQKEKQKGTLATHGFVRKNAQEKRAEGLLPREIKEVALAVWLLDTRTPLYRLETASWKEFCKQIHLEMPKPDHLRRVHFGNIFECFLRLRRRLFEKAGFVHIEFDFMSLGASKFLIVCGCAVVDFEIFNDILGIVEYIGTEAAGHVSSMVHSTLSRVTSNSVLLSSVTVDGALRAAGTAVAEGDDDDVLWCFAHQFALPVKKSLEGDDSVSKDFSFLHFFGVYLRSHAPLREVLELEQRREGHEPKRVLLDSLARWTSEFRKVKRFLELESFLITIVKQENVQQLVSGWIEDGHAPVDVFKPRFFARLRAMKGVLEVFHEVIKLSQASTHPVVSQIPFFLARVETAVILVEDEPAAVAAWKDKFRALFLNQFRELRTSYNTMWLAVALDPRFADLKKWNISQELEDQIWENVGIEHVNLKRLRFAREYGDQMSFPESRERTALSYVDTARVSMKFWHDKLWKEKKSEKKSVLEINPLLWWKEMSEKGAVNDSLAEFKELALTACMFLSRRGTTAAAERGVGRVRHTLTPFRMMLSEGFAEQEVVASHFIRTPQYNFEKLCEELALLQKELKTKK